MLFKSRGGSSHREHREGFLEEGYWSMALEDGEEEGYRKSCLKSKGAGVEGWLWAWEGGSKGREYMYTYD